MRIQYRTEDKLINTKNSLMSTVRCHKSYKIFKICGPVKSKDELTIKVRDNPYDIMNHIKMIKLFRSYFLLQEDTNFLSRADCKNEA